MHCADKSYLSMVRNVNEQTKTDDAEVAGTVRSETNMETDQEVDRSVRYGTVYDVADVDRISQNGAEQVIDNERKSRQKASGAQLRNVGAGNGFEVDCIAENENEIFHEKEQWIDIDFNNGNEEDVAEADMSTWDETGSNVNEKNKI